MRIAVMGLGAIVAAAVLACPAPASAAPESLGLKACDDVLPGAMCGHLARPWDPSGSVPGTVSVGFAFLPASSGAAVGTVVPVQGGPGYSTSSDAATYAEMYGGLLRDRNLLIVDQRGTGMSDPISCPSLQSGSWDWVTAVGRCGRRLGAHSGWYGTAMAADDLAAVIQALGLGRVDLYGDSYGTWFGQVMSGRHPEVLRTVVLDASYPVLRESPWYPSQGPALRRSLSTVCERSPRCHARIAHPVRDLETLLDRVRREPIEVIAPGGDGRRHRVLIDAPSLVGVAFNGTYVPPTYRELAASVQAALKGDALPLGRLLAEYEFTGEGASSIRDYSEGLWAAVSCHDYPQLFDMTAPASTRHVQYRAAIRRAEVHQPDMYAPFTIREYLASDFAEEGVCQEWPRPADNNPPGPPSPPGGEYPSIPTVILAGEFDTITTPYEGQLVQQQLPDATRLLVANALHVTAMDDPQGCSATLVRRVVRSGSNAISADTRRCAHRYPRIRAVGDYARTMQSQSPRRIAAMAAATAADLTDRWWQDSTRHGHGLRGGRWTYQGYSTVRFTLDGVRLVDDLPVTGTATWDRRAGTFACDLTVGGVGGVRYVRGAWSTTERDARAHVTVGVADHARRVSFLAP